MEIFLLAVSAAVNPTLLAATTVMLLLPTPRNLMLGIRAPSVPQNTR